MKPTKFLLLPLVLALLGFGCAHEYGTKETSQPPVNTVPQTEQTVQQKIVTAPSSSTAKLIKKTPPISNKKEDVVLKELDVEPSGVLNLNQGEYSMADRLSWYETLQWPRDCEADYRLTSDQERGDLAFYKITDNQYLLRITCYLGAYQQGMLFMRVYDDRSDFFGTIIDLKTYDPIKKRLVYFDNDGTHQVLGFEKFDDTNKTLNLYTKSRGIGDCGSYHNYQITATDATLIKMTAQDCEVADAWHLEHPDDINMPPWPVIYEKK